MNRVRIFLRDWLRGYSDKDVASARQLIREILKVMPWRYQEWLLERAMDRSFDWTVVPAPLRPKERLALATHGWSIVYEFVSRRQGPA